MELIFSDDAYATDCEATVLSVSEEGVRLDRTVFYPMGGGQPGDSGTLTPREGPALTVADTRKGADHQDVVHVLADGTPPPPVGAPVRAAIDWDRRHRHMRMHTTLHLLCALVDGDVTGGQVGADKSRLDFNVPGEALDKATLTDRLNALIEADHPVEALWITDADLTARPELVRTMSVRPPSGAGRVRLLRIGGSVDLQPCGGTHVRRTGEIGPVTVTKIENKGRQNRRVVVALV